MADSSIAGANEVGAEMDMSLSRLSDYLLLMSMSITHDIVPDATKESVAISLEHAMRVELIAIADQRDRLEQLARGQA